MISNRGLGSLLTFALLAGWASAAAIRPALAAPADADLLAPGASDRVVFDGRSKWNRVLVIDRGDHRSLYFGDADGDTQSTVSLREPTSVPMEYIRHAASALAFTTQRRSGLVVGLGGGTFPMLLRRSYPDMRIDVVELDPMVRKVAGRYFGLVESAKLRVHLADGAAFMGRTRGRWDVVLLDAYGAGGIPTALATDKFFADVALRVSPGGIVIANIADTNAVAERAMIDRFAKAFASCVMLHTPRSDNIIAVASASLPKDLAAALQGLDREARLPFPVAPMAGLFQPCTPGK